MRLHNTTIKLCAQQRGIHSLIKVKGLLSENQYSDRPYAGENSCISDSHILQQNMKRLKQFATFRLKLL